MADTITTDQRIFGARMGWGWLRDNHGNSAIGHALTCAGEPSVNLGASAFNSLYDAIGVPSGSDAWLHQREFPMWGGMESPLQTMCREIAAKKHHSKGRETGRAK
jgi:hypothetical protein